MTNAYNTDVTFKDYLTCIKGKTLNYLNSVVTKEHTLAYTQTSEILSKPVLNDVKQGVYTLPLILGMERDDAFILLLEKGEQLTDNDLDTVVSLLHDNDCIERAYGIAKTYIDNALASIEQLPDHPIKEVLYALTKRLLTRES